MSVTQLPRMTKRTKPAPPAATETSANLHKAPSAGNVQLPLQVPPEVRRAYKGYAAERDLSMSALFMLMWDDYRARNG